jgi:GntR family transcriptional regulator
MDDLRIRGRKNGSFMTRRLGEGKLYTMVSDHLRRQIRAGARRPGDSLPAMDKLAKEFGVSVITVRTAIEILEEEGLLIRRQGRGTFVTRTAQVREWLGMSTTWDDLISGYSETTAKSENEVLVEERDRQLPVDAVDDLTETAAPSYVFMRRRHRMEGVIYACTDLYLDERLFDRTPDAFRQDMVLQVLNDLLGAEIGTATQRITINTADAATADLLDLTIGAPVGELLRRVSDRGGMLIYRAVVRYRGDLVRIETKLR